MPDSYTNVQNWPNVVFKALLTAFSGLLIYLGSAIYAQQGEMMKAINALTGAIRENGQTDGFQKEKFDKLESKFEKHIETSNAEKKELQREVEALKYINKIR